LFGEGFERAFDATPLPGLKSPGGPAGLKNGGMGLSRACMGLFFYLGPTGLKWDAWGKGPGVFIGEYWGLWSILCSFRGYES